MNKGYFVTATGTDVGKTFVTALLVKKWRESSINAGYYKAALSGAELINGKWIAGDANYVKNIANLNDTQEEMVSYIYKEAVSPHLAAQKEGNPVELSKICNDFKNIQKKHEFLFVEGSGGIICPIRYNKNDSAKKIFLEDIIKTINFPILIVTTATLGSINSAVLTAEYAKARNLNIRGFIVNHYGQSKNLEMENDNISMIQDLTQLNVLAKIPDGATDLGVDIF